VRLVPGARRGPAAPSLAKLPRAAFDLLSALAKDPGGTDVAAIKQIETRTNHDVKAVEIWLRNELKSRGAAPAELEWLHFGCTSEDINNLAYALMLKSARATVLLPMLDAIGELLDALAQRHAAAPMLARTHGQTATPTTVGKELANVAARLQAQRAGIERVGILGKMNGAVGNFNAHVAALPQVDWPEFSGRFVESLGLAPNPYTTQIEPHDWIAEYCHALMRANTMLLDLARDCGPTSRSAISSSAGRRRSRLLDHAAQGEPHRLRKRRGQSRHWPTRCWGTSPTSCPCLACSAT
jgi:adenylosuccinate lyase